MARSWNSFVSSGAAMCALFSEFVIAVPSGGGENLWFKYGKFLVAVCIGLWFVPGRVWSLRRHRWKWRFIAFALAVCSLVSVLRYTEIVRSWSVQYWRSERIVIGETLLPDAQKYLEKLRARRPSATPRDVLDDSAGDATRVWVVGEIETRARTITLLYLLTLFLLSSSVVTISQAAYGATRAGSVIHSVASNSGVWLEHALMTMGGLRPN
jgi:hypothetical protein